jgi:hypothetical protein
MQKFALGSEERLFIVKEGVSGVLEYPNADGSDCVLTVGAATNTQEDEMLEDGQIRGRRSRFSPIKGRTMAGAWSFTTYVKPSGALGVAPECDVLLECAFGKKTVDPGVKVEYEFDSSIVLPSFSLLRKIGHQVWYGAGFTVNQMQATVSGAAIAQIAWSGGFMKHWYAGESVLAAICSPAADEIEVEDATRFSDSMVRINIGDDDNGGDGYLVTAVNYTTNMISFSPVAAVGADLGDPVTPWYPSTVAAEVGVPVHGKRGKVSLDTVSAVVLEGSLTLVNNIKYYEDMKDGHWYPVIYGTPGFRDVNGMLRTFFYKNIPSYFYRSSYQQQDALILPAGDVPGRIMEISCSRIEYKTPALSGDAEVLAELAFNAIASASGDDELKITFK